jgi:hypothetical protein
MLPVFKYYKPYFLAFVLLLTTAQIFAQQIVYDVKQDWVYFNSEHGGFLPVGEDDHQNKIISFNLSDSEFDKFYLTIAVQHKAYLFYRTKLLTTLPVGVSSYRIDSIKQLINDQKPFLTIYGDKLLPGLSTEVRTNYVENETQLAYQPIRFANNFSNFFYLAVTLIVVFFVILKVQFSELAGQYLLVNRAFKIRTIDESIYKIQYLAFPNNLFIVFMSLVLSLLLLSFMYFFPGQLHFMDINPGASSFPVLVITWVEIFLVILVFFILKYFLTILVSSTFALKVENIHYASSLRFIMMLSLAMLLLVSTEIIMVGVIPEPVFWIVFIMAIIIMEVILFFKLTLVSSHTLLYIITYLCATEIIPMVFLFKLVTV